MAIDESGSKAVLGCMTSQTAVASKELGLSFGSVLKVDKQVVFVLAAPSEGSLKARSWMRPASTPVVVDGFDVAVFELVLDEFEFDGSPTEQQIQRFALEADVDTITTGGFGPDLFTE
jgi:hypothetical protein